MLSKRRRDLKSFVCCNFEFAHDFYSKGSCHSQGHDTQTPVNMKHILFVQERAAVIFTGYKNQWNSDQQSTQQQYQSLDTLFLELFVLKLYWGSRALIVFTFFFLIPITLHNYLNQIHHLFWEVKINFCMDSFVVYRV